MAFNLYERIAGQKLNIGKLEFSVSPNMDEVMSTVFSDFLQMPTIYQHTKYLGLPLMISQK